MARFVVNQGDYKYREMLVVIVCLIFLIGAIKYSQRVNLIVVRFQTKKECIQLLLLLLNILDLVNIFAGASKNNCVWGVMEAAGGGFLAGAALTGPLGVFGGAMAGVGAAVALCK